MQKWLRTQKQVIINSMCMQQEKHQLKKVIFMTLARRIHERTAERSQHNIYSAFSKGYKKKKKKNPRNSMHLALFCEEKPKGKVIRRELTRVYLEARDFNLVTQKESISR